MFNTKKIIAAGLAASIFAGCAQKTESVSSVSTSTSSAEAQRIVDLSGNSDILSILGYKVVGTANSDAYDYTKFPAYLEETLAGAEIVGYSMQDTMDIENIVALNPDLVVISNVQEKMKDQLSELAEVKVINNDQTDWKKDVRSTAEAFDKTEAAEEWLSAYEAKAEEAGAALREAYGEDTTYLSMLVSGGQIYLFDAAGFGSVLYEDLGLARRENLPVQENISLPVVTVEGLAAIEADILFLIGTDADLAEIKDNAVFNTMASVKNGKVVELPASPYFNQGYSAIGRNLLLDEIPEMLKEVQ